MRDKPIPVSDINVKEILDNLPITINFNDIVFVIKRFTKILDNEFWIIPTHSHDSYEFHYVTGGKGHIEVENNNFDVAEGDFYITAPFVRHKQISSKSNTLEEYTIECKIMFPEKGKNTVEDNELNILKSLISKTFYTRFTEKKNLIKDLLRIEKESDEKNFGYWIKMESLLITVVIEFLSIAFTYYEQSFENNKIDLNEQRLTKISNYIEDNIARDISIEDISKEFYLSSRQINRILTKNYSMSFHQHLTSIRNETAVRLLRESNFNFSEIAKRSGFGNYLQMFRALKNAGYPAPSKIKMEEM